jgi:RimJ/RimL family protein N-acetyltransferase/catechol 2,3-dioxygenase-like lactoylglutathione lyase family enzyme
MILKTDRLVLRPLTKEDGDALHPAFSDADTLKYWHLHPTTTIEESRERAAMHAYGAAVFAIRESEDGDAIGFTGFGSNLHTDHQGAFGYLLRKEQWGKGYVVEASRAVLDHGFNHLGFPAAELWIYDGNAQSRRVAEKLGATYRGANIGFNLLKGPRTTHVYEIAAPSGQLPPEVLRAIPVLRVGDLDDAVAWYRERLNFTLEWSFPGTAAMISPGWLPLAAGIRLREGKARPSRVVFQVAEGLDDIAESLGTEAQTQGLLRAVEVSDPWGNELVFETPVAR